MSNRTLDMGPGLVVELYHAMKRSGRWTDELVKEMSKGDFLDRVAQVLEGDGKIEICQHEINCDKRPFVPRGWKLVSHEKQGKIIWHRGDRITTRYNANVLDYLFAHTELLRGQEHIGHCAFTGTMYNVQSTNVWRVLHFSPTNGWAWDYMPASESI